MANGKQLGRLVDDGLGGLTYRIIGCAMSVHNALGPGLKEEHYEKALAAALAQESLTYERQKPLEVRLDESSVGVVILDLLVGGNVIVEVKARQWLLTNDEIGQVITYLLATDLHVGLLINFGRKRLDYRRVFRPKKLVDSRVARYVVNPKDSR
jgi:GxxExxY protein